MAQLVEHILGKDEVPSSNLGSSSKKATHSGCFFCFLELLPDSNSVFSLCEKASSHSPPEDRQARLAGKGCANLRFSEYLGFPYLPPIRVAFLFLGAASRYSLLRIPGVAVFVNNFKESATPIDKSANKCYNDSKLINQTVEAEITATMPSQRAQGAEIWVRNKLSNGPRRAQSKAKCFAEYSATLQADVICRGYVGILLSAQPFWEVNLGGPADK